MKSRVYCILQNKLMQFGHRVAFLKTLELLEELRIVAGIIELSLMLKPYFLAPPLDLSLALTFLALGEAPFQFLPFDCIPIVNAVPALHMQ